MKKYIIIVLISVISFSCEDFLDLGPDNRINTQSFYKNQKDFEVALVGAYSTLQGLHGSSLHLFAEMATDNAEIQLPNPTSNEMQLDEINFTPSNTNINSYWSSCYSLITKCNTILSRIEAFNDINETVKKTIQGECLFLRAYGYFYLTRMFGEVSIVTEEFTSPNQVAVYDMSRKPVADVYRLILDDLANAESLLAPAVPSNRGKVSLGAVKTLLAKVYLTQKEYAKAATELEKVMVLKKADGSPAYKLEADYGKLFSYANDDNDESIFEIEFVSGNLGEGNNYAHHFYPLIQQMAVFKGNLLAGGRCVPTLSLMNAYEDGDKRKNASVDDQIPLTNGSFTTSTFCKKFIDYNVTILSDGGVNFTEYRYADILLMYAEVLNELDRADADVYLNEVRVRAGLEGKTWKSKDSFRLIIEQERRVEFAYECHRWFDLIRTGRLKDVMNMHFESKGLAFSVEDHEWLLPVPQTQRDIDSNLSQNPGY
jgi:tetratricopeptide (TPR) repeat protein